MAIVTINATNGTFASSDCTLAGGETGTGFRNDARLIAGTTTTVTDCAPFASIRVLKTIVAGSPGPER